jgi:alkylhydroperoxidase family enzyme
VADPLAELRTLASTAPEDDARLETYLAKVRSGAFAITDADVEELKRAGLSEDEIFEATVAVAAAEGLRRLDAATRVIA